MLLYTFLKVLMNNILPIEIIKSMNLGNISLHFVKKKKTGNKAREIWDSALNKLPKSDLRSRYTSSGVLAGWLSTFRLPLQQNRGSCIQPFPQTKM